MQLHILFAIAKKFAAQTRKFCAAIPPQIIFCDFCVANFAAQIWRKNAQKGAKNPRKRKQFLRFCAAIPPQIFAHGNPNCTIYISIRIKFTQYTEYISQPTRLKHPCSTPTPCPHKISLLIRHLDVTSAYTSSPTNEEPTSRIKNPPALLPLATRTRTYEGSHRHSPLSTFHLTHPPVTLDRPN